MEGPQGQGRLIVKIVIVKWNEPVRHFSPPRAPLKHDSDENSHEMRICPTDLRNCDSLGDKLLV